MVCCGPSSWLEWVMPLSDGNAACVPLMGNRCISSDLARDGLIPGGTAYVIPAFSLSCRILATKRELNVL